MFRSKLRRADQGWTTPKEIADSSKAQRTRERCQSILYIASATLQERGLTARVCTSGIRYVYVAPKEQSIVRANGGY
jgi:hypothetical protein